MIFLFHDTSAPWSYLQISSFWGRYSTKLDNALILRLASLESSPFNIFHLLLSLLSDIGDNKRLSKKGGESQRVSVFSESWDQIRG